MTVCTRFVRHLVVSAAAAVAWSAATLPAHATPRLAMRLGQDCLLCHQNPSGGGMRSEYASQYLLPERLTMKAGVAENGAEEAPFANPRIADNVVLGLDLRTAYLDLQNQDAGNNFLQMEGALHLSVELSPSASIQLSEEMAQGAARAVEIYGLAFVLPGSGFVKVGRFVPAFGWKLDDHRAFTRREFVFLPAFPPHSDTGVELGYLHGGWSLQVSATNGEFAAAREQGDELAWTARGSWRRDVSGGHVALGGSYMQHRGIRRTASNASGADVYAGGPFAGVRVGSLTWLGEFDWAHREAGNEAGNGPASFLTFTTSQELSWEIAQGIDLVALYDFHDVDVREETGALARYGGAIDARVRPWISVHAGVTHLEAQDGPDLAARAGSATGGNESIVMIHFLY